MHQVNFFGHQVSKLIVGDNPFNGHSYVLDWVGREEMKEYYTAEHFKESLREIEKNGFNTMLPLADPMCCAFSRSTSGRAASSSIFSSRMCPWTRR